MSSLFVESSSFCGYKEGNDFGFDEDDQYGESVLPGQWLGDLTASLTQTFKDSIPQTKNVLDDFAGVIKRSANALATELASFEEEAGKEARKWAENLPKSDGEEDNERVCLYLPWQVQEEIHVHDENKKIEDSTDKTQPLQTSTIVEDEELKSEILDLSKNDSTFTQPYIDENDESKTNLFDEGEFSFDLESHMDIIHRLLQIDSNLRRAHAKLSLRKVKEQHFWKNYFYHCAALKKGREVVKIELRCGNKKNEFLPTIGCTAIKKLESDFVNVQQNFGTPIGGHVPKITSVSKTNDSSCSNVESCEQEIPRTLSMGDLVLVGSESDELNKIAAELS